MDNNHIAKAGSHKKAITHKPSQTTQPTSSSVFRPDRPAGCLIKPNIKRPLPQQQLFKIYEDDPVRMKKKRQKHETQPSKNVVENNATPFDCEDKENKVAVSQNPTSYSNTILNAIKGGRKETLLAYIRSNGVDAQVMGKTLLIHACRYGNLASIDCLIENNAQVNLEHKAGRDALYYAIDKGHLEAVKRLLQVVSKSESIHEKLIQVVKKGNPEMFRAFLAKGINPTLVDDNDENALSTAMSLDQFEIFNDIVKFIQDNHSEKQIYCEGLDKAMCHCKKSYQDILIHLLDSKQQPDNVSIKIS